MAVKRNVDLSHVGCLFLWVSFLKTYPGRSIIFSQLSSSKLTQLQSIFTSKLKPWQNGLKKKSWRILSGTEIKNFIVYFKSSWKLLNYLFFLSWTEFLTDISPFPLFIFECWIIFNYHEHSACIKELTNHYCQLLHTYVLPTHEVSKTEKRKNWL